MTTAPSTLILQPMIKGLIGELEKFADTKGEVSNDDIVGSFQNVVMIDYGMKVSDLPEKLQNLYYRSTIVREKRHRLRTLRMDLDHMSREV